MCENELDRDLAADYARAIGLCRGVTSAAWSGPSDARARNIVADFGSVYLPREGARMIVLSTGIAADEGDPGHVAPQPGTNLGDENEAAHPAPRSPADGCAGADPSEVADYTELTLELTAPGDAHSFRFDFNFLSSEYPEWVCGSYGDTFVVMLESDAFSGNIAFDSAGNPMSINSGFLSVCEPSSEPPGFPGFCVGNADLAGTGYQGDGGTGWLTTTAPVGPGETIRLRFVIFDEGDHILDSAVLIDGFRWNAGAVEEPVTVPAT